jgi:hypothetical protein
MKIFILEDDQNRLDFFYRWFENEEIFASDNVEYAKTLYLKERPFDLVFLDHDLGGRVYVSSEEPNTGYQFAKFLVEQENSSIIIIHSWNPEGAKNMRNVLPKAYVIPFGSHLKRMITLA